MYALHRRPLSCNPAAPDSSVPGIPSKTIELPLGQCDMERHFETFDFFGARHGHSPTERFNRS
jgi:hypothetical protein